MGKGLTCKHLIVFGLSRLLHLVNDSVSTESSSWNLNCFEWSNSTGNTANASAWIIYVEIKPLSGLKVASKNGSPVDSLIDGIYWHRGIHGVPGSRCRPFALDNKSGHTIGTVLEIKNGDN